MLRLTRDQSRQVDQRASADYHIPGIVLMENAARGVVEAACKMLGASCAGSPIMILVGGGNNGGDGLAAARHLHNRQASVTIILTVDPSKFTGDAAINWNIVSAMKLPVVRHAPGAIGQFRPHLIIDAIFGTGLQQPPRAPFDQIADAVSRQACPILSVDLPSGLDADRGVPYGSCIRATRTVTFIAEKAGFANPVSHDYTGVVTVADIGAPRELVEHIARGD